MRIDDEIKEQARILYDELGLDLTTAITLFLKQSIREQSLPFLVTLDADENSRIYQEVLTNCNQHNVPTVENLTFNIINDD